MKKLVVASIVLFVFALPVICAEIDGQWIGVKDGPDRLYLMISVTVYYVANHF